MIISPAIVLAWMLRLTPDRLHNSTYPGIAEGIARAANEDPDPLDAAVTLTAIARFESVFTVDALSRPDDPAKSIGLFQLSTRWILFPASPYHQAKTALWLVRASQERCGTLAEYTAGTCRGGTLAAAERYRLAARLRAAYYFDPDPALPAKRRVVW